ncbi:uncharacterized protein LOC133834159 [Humulus lupulus]|uniref:uncharacterized protein LOC133834159 n=1 Tax=Humulus lupulus TaxID=3486 RepID=UPI002B412966|nr:uncharacterized protein LOC133834159 [Humulus lupulus]
MNKGNKQRDIHNLCRLNNIGFGALFETKVRHEKTTGIISNSFPNWDYYSSNMISFRILLIWQSKFVQVQILGEDTQKILWDKLAGLGHLNLPWIVLGDFNAMFNYQDRNGGRPITAKEIFDAQNWLSLDQVDELRCAGNIGIKPFRFFDCWMFHSMFKTVVLDSWNKATSKAGLACIILKLFRVKHVLKKFNKKDLGDISHSYQVAKESFNLAQGALANDPSNTMLQLTEQIKLQELIQARKRYASFLQQTSKITWLQFNDENSHYFHAIMKKRRAENRITSYVVNEEVIDDYDKVVEHYFNHFKNFMGKKSSANRQIDTNSLSFGEKLTVQKQVKLIRPFNKKDVQEALFGIHSIKSPGPDGFGAGFFKGLWNEIGNDISMAVLQFFHDGVLPNDLNETVISLIPKTDSPKTVADCRPIACCNTLYKCISKMLCSRLSEVLPILIHGNQGAFIKNRLLAHNILIFQDLLKGYTRKNISARCIMKIDLSKAYDTVDWQFVADLLKGLCFPSRFIHWVLVFLKGTSYSLMLNGQLHGTFRGENGLRQGDPISPLLFVLIMEYLTRLLLQTSKQKGFGFHPLCKHVNLVNLCFADDLVIFCKGNVKSMRLTQFAIESFCATTGLSINNTKTHIYFGGIKDDCKSQFLEITQMEEGSFPLKYLGIHLRPTKWRAVDCGEIIEKIQRNLHSWTSRNLSFAGRAQLIHLVLLGIRNFWMNIFILPQKVVAVIDKCCRDFLWGTKGNRSKLHLTSWEQVCLPKKFGGVGFFEGRKWNIAMMAKYIWAISSKKDCLWVKWIDSIYLKGHSFWTVPLINDTRWYFRKLLKLRNGIDCSAVNTSVLRGKFKAKFFYLSLTTTREVQYASAVWHRLCVPKHRFISWQVINEHLLTRDNLGKILELATYLCPVCECVNESHQHLFFDCSFTKKLQQEVSSWSGVKGWPLTMEAWKIWSTSVGLDIQSLVWNAILSAVFYSVWCNRNRCVFELCCSSVMVVSSSIKLAIKARVKGIECTKAKKRDRDLIATDSLFSAVLPMFFPCSSILIPPGLSLHLVVLMASMHSTLSLTAKEKQVLNMILMSILSNLPPEHILVARVTNVMSRIFKTR